MSDPTKLYWDSSCFICLLSPDEAARAVVCKDILKNGELGNTTIYTSMWTVVEVVRPKRPGVSPLPTWANDAIAAIEKAHPNVRAELDMLWRRHQSDTVLPKLTADQIAKIEGMFFGWPFLKLIRVDKQVSRRAVALQRDYNLKAGDSIHVASALSVKELHAFQAWDRDFSKVDTLLKVSDPQYITPEGPLIEAMREGDKNEQLPETPEPVTAEIRGSGGNASESEAGAATASAIIEEEAEGIEKPKATS